MLSFSSNCLTHLPWAENELVRYDRVAHQMNASIEYYSNDNFVMEWY